MRSFELIENVYKEGNYSSWNELAEKAGLPPATLSNWKNNKSLPEYETLRKITKELNLNLENIRAIVEIERVQKQREKLTMRLQELESR